MTSTQSSSTSNPLDDRVLAIAVEFVLKADSMGLLTSSVDTLNLDLDAIIKVACCVTKQGIGRRIVINPERWYGYSSDDLACRLRQLTEIMEETPIPEKEWKRIRTLLNDDMVAKIIGISEQSVRRYATDERATPDDVAARLHWLALTTGDLQGAYNDDGVRNWFKRPRKSFGDKSPIAILGGQSWSPAAEEAKRIRKFARELTESMGT